MSKKGMRMSSILTKRAVHLTCFVVPLALAFSCKVENKDDYTFTDDPTGERGGSAGKGGSSGRGGTAGSSAGKGGSSGSDSGADAGAGNNEGGAGGSGGTSGSGGSESARCEGEHRVHGEGLRIGMVRCSGRNHGWIPLLSQQVPLGWWPRINMGLSVGKPRGPA